MSAETIREAIDRALDVAMRRAVAYALQNVAATLLDGLDEGERKPARSAPRRPAKRAPEPEVVQRDPKPAKPRKPRAPKPEPEPDEVLGGACWECGKGAADAFTCEEDGCDFSVAWCGKHGGKAVGGKIGGHKRKHGIARAASSGDDDEDDDGEPSRPPPEPTPPTRGLKPGQKGWGSSARLAPIGPDTRVVCSRCGAEIPFRRASQHLWDRHQAAAPTADLPRLFPPVEGS